MIVTLAIGFAVLALVIGVGLDGIRREAARSARAQYQAAEAMSKLAEQAAAIQMRCRDIQYEHLRLEEKIKEVKNEELRQLVETTIARGGRILDG